MPDVATRTGRPRQRDEEGTQALRRRTQRPHRRGQAAHYERVHAVERLNAALHAGGVARYIVAD